MKYFVSLNNGMVVRREDGAIVPKHFYPLSQQEVEEYLAWTKRVAEAQAEGAPTPPIPKFGPEAFADDASRVVADVVAEDSTVDTVKQPTVLKLAPEPTEAPDESSELLKGLLSDGEDG